MKLDIDHMFKAGAWLSNEHSNSHLKKLFQPKEHVAPRQPTVKNVNKHAYSEGSIPFLPSGEKVLHLVSGSSLLYFSNPVTVLHPRNLKGHMGHSIVLLDFGHALALILCILLFMTCGMKMCILCYFTLELFSFVFICKGNWN